jgi:hypothetical protein
LFIWQTTNGRDFLKTDVETEPWQWLGSTLVVEHNSAAGLAAAIIENGLTIGDH